MKKSLNSKKRSLDWKISLFVIGYFLSVIPFVLLMSRYGDILKAISPSLLKLVISIYVALPFYVAYRFFKAKPTKNKVRAGFERIEEQNREPQKIPLITMLVLIILFIAFIGYCAYLGMGDKSTPQYILQAILLVVWMTILVLAIMIGAGYSLGELDDIRAGYKKITPELKRKIRYGYAVTFVAIALFIITLMAIK